MLERLRPCALLRVDDEQEQVDAGRAGDHRPHETLVPRDVDEGEPPSVGEVERAYPRSIEMPRRFSSGSRSVSFPVSALTSVVLPWSICPAVPTTSELTAVRR